MSENPRTTADSDGQASGMVAGSVWDILVSEIARSFLLVDAQGNALSGALVSIREPGQDEDAAKIIKSSPYGRVSLAGFSEDCQNLMIRVLAKGTAHAQPSKPSAPPSSSPSSSSTPAETSEPEPMATSSSITPNNKFTDYHNPHKGTRWRLTTEGIEVEAAGHLRTSGPPKTMILMWKDFGEHILEASRKLSVPVDIIAAMISVEAATIGRTLAFDPRSDREEPGYESDSKTPNRRSCGLMQTLLSTAQESADKYKSKLGELTVTPELLFEPAYSILVGTAYIARKIEQYDADPPLLCAAYNAGKVFESKKNDWKLRMNAGSRMDKYISRFNDFHAAVREGSISLPECTLTALGQVDGSSTPARQVAALSTEPSAAQNDPSDKEGILALYAHLDPDRIIKDRHREAVILYYHKHRQELANHNVVSVIDFSVRRSVKRWHFIDMKTGAVDSVHVAHGRNSEVSGGMATKFSNDSGSNKSSIGFYKAAETYEGSNPGNSLKLDGLSETNSNARSRYIVVHSANYVTSTGAGRSLGCPAVSHENREYVIGRIKGGSLIYADV